jgi:hypothetical protein
MQSPRECRLQHSAIGLLSATCSPVSDLRHFLYRVMGLDGGGLQCRFVLLLIADEIIGSSVFVFSFSRGDAGSRREQQQQQQLSLLFKPS